MPEPRLSARALRRVGDAPPGVDLDVAAGEIVCLVGPNGAGKSTVLQLVAGAAAAGGSIRIDGVEVAGEALAGRVRRGIVLGHAGGRVFPAMTVEENLRVGWEAGARTTTFAACVDDATARFPWLLQRLGQRADSLSGGERHILAAARTLFAAPRLLLLDEPASGLSVASVDRLGQWIADATAAGASALVAEQAPGVAAATASRTILMAGGRLVGETRGVAAARGGARELVERLFFGERAGHA